MTSNDLVADTVLDAAYDWLCHRRRAYPADADVWTLRRHWPTVKAALTRIIHEGPESPPRTV